jgi:NAD(P) transhydrogenase subunit beta
MSNSALLNICYLIGSLGFIIGLKMLSKPETARKGNWVAAVGMAIAIFGTIFLYTDPETGNGISNLTWIIGGMVVGTILGTVSAKKVQMTAMPQMVSIFNGMGGICAGLIGIIEFRHLVHFTEINGGTLMTGHALIILLGLIIGTVSFAGSVVAFLKLNGNLNDYSFKGQTFFNLFFLVAVFGVALFMMNGDVANAHMMMYVLFGMACIYGISFVMPIGGADMPVVISLLNSFTGVAAAFGGFLYNNGVMLTGGILVGAAGTLLTVLMCKAMNRSLLNVIIGSFGGGGATAIVSESGGVIKEISAGDVAINMSYAQKVIIVPGYGLAVAQAQHICHELEKQLTEKGVDVKYAIHPVAGRMPGHMNVLLAEADVSYDKLLEMDAANDEFATTDVVLILGANDVVNPAAKTNPASPIYGMPILEVEKAKTVIVNKRSMNKGYAGIDNELFYGDKTRMLFGDAKKMLAELVNEVKAN